MRAFHAILRTWLGSRSVSEGAARLRIAPRTLHYLLAGTTQPNGSTLALIERTVAQGAGISVATVRASVRPRRRVRKPTSLC